MNQLFSKMRELSIRDLKERREEIFERTRKMMQNEGSSYDDEESSYQETENANSVDAMEEQHFEHSGNGKRNKKHEENNRIRRYWRKLLQVTDWMLAIPENIKEFYVVARPDGNKCLVIFKDYRLELRDKSGGLIFSCSTNGKSYDRSIFEAYYNKQLQTLVLSDLIVWKNNPMTSSEFEFRYSWLISNVNLGTLRTWTNLNVFMAGFQPCNWQGLKQAYSGSLAYPKEGLLFVHKDSFYIHGLNPNVIIWKDLNTSKYLLSEIEDSKSGSRGIGFLNKQGEIKSIEYVHLFNLDRKTIDATHRFVRFAYKNMTIENIQDDRVKVFFEELKIIDSLKNYNGPIDSLGKLLYKCRVGTSLVRIEEIAEKCSEVQVELKPE